LAVAGFNHRLLTANTTEVTVSIIPCSNANACLIRCEKSWPTNSRHQPGRLSMESLTVELQNI
jgi:hypothetical protein